MMTNRLLSVAVCFPLLVGAVWQTGSCAGSAGNSAARATNRNSAPRTANAAATTDNAKEEMSNDKRERKGRVASGSWGGEHVRLDVRAGGAEVEFDCAHGTLDAALETDAGGRFDVRGTFVRERGGPVRLGEKPDSTPARYSGSVRGDEMTLTVTFGNSDEDGGTFTLRRGAEGRLRKCR